MSVIRGVALFLTVAAAGVLVGASGPDGGASTAGGRLKTISSSVNAKGASLVIVTTEPMPYMATRPDPLTVLVEIRNAAADGVANSVAANAKSPIVAVTTEPAESTESPGSRVRITLAQPVKHRVRSDRNRIIVEFDKTLVKAAPPVLVATSAGASPSNTGGVADLVQTLAAQAAIDPIDALGLNAPTATIQDATSAAVRPSTSPPALQRTLAAQVPQPAAQPQAGRRFTGHAVSLDFQGADLRAVLRTFSEISGLNVVIDPTVQGSVDVALRDVPWDQALDLILRANRLGYIVDGTIVRIAPLVALADEETQRRKLSEEQALAGELRVQTKTLSYAKVEDLQTLLTKSVLSQRGTVQIDPRTNTLIITDLQEKLNQVSDLIATLDRPQPQVEIEARIVQTNKNYARALGVQWGFNGRVDPALGNTTNLAFPNSGTLSGGVNATVGSGSSAVPAAVNLAATGATSGVGLALGSINGAFNLDVALSALESSGNGRLLSTPRVTTQNNVAAEMTQGVQIPIQTVANNTVTVTFKDAALTMKVTPQITAANTVILQISVENASPDFSRAVNNIPPINTQRANTSVLVSDGQTTVIGGIYVSQEQAQTDRTPGLGQIPLLKWLFKRDSVNDQSTELLIFITPRIIKG